MRAFNGGLGRILLIYGGRRKMEVNGKRN